MMGILLVVSFAVIWGVWGAVFCIAEAEHPAATSFLWSIATVVILILIVISNNL